MKDILSHFQVTYKSLFALVTAVLGFYVMRGQMTVEQQQAYLAIAAAFLAILVPSRAPHANQEPGTTGNTEGNP